MNGKEVFAEKYAKKRIFYITFHSSGFGGMVEDKMLCRLLLWLVGGRKKRLGFAVSLILVNFVLRNNVLQHKIGAMIVEPVVDFQEVACRISKLWNLLSASEREAVKCSARLQSYRKNELIYQEGENPDHLLCLLSGKVKIFRDGVGGRSQIMRLMRPVQYFGYRASLANEPYVTAASAFEPSLVCSIPMGVVTEAMASNNALCRFFVGELATDLGISDRRTVSLTQKHIRGRLAESLLFLMETYGFEPDSTTLGIRLSREDLANLSNMTTSNAIRTLSDFAAEGLLFIDGRSITVRDERMLRRISRIG